LAYNNLFVLVWLLAHCTAVLLLLQNEDEDTLLSSADLLVTVWEEKARSSSSKAEACAAAVRRTVARTSWNAVVVVVVIFDVLIFRPRSARQTPSATIVAPRTAFTRQLQLIWKVYLLIATLLCRTS
jgi:hypothetical protein